MLDTTLGSMQMSIEQIKKVPGDAFDERIDRLDKSYSTLEGQLESQLETRLLGFAAQLEKEQLAGGTRSQQVYSAISELQVQVLVKDTCSAIEARWKAEIEHLRRSGESVSEQLSDLQNQQLRSAMLVKDTCGALQAQLKTETERLRSSDESLAEQFGEVQYHQLHSTISELQAQLLVDVGCAGLEARWKSELEQLKNFGSGSLADQFEELRKQHMQSAVSEFQAQVLVDDSCNALEARWKAELEQMKRSAESLANQFEDLHMRYEKETRAGGVCVPELVTSMLELKHINLPQQVLMEGRSNSDTDQPSATKRGQTKTYWALSQ
jgi:hypothetical protein